MSLVPRSRLLKPHELSRDDRGGSCRKTWRAIDGDRSNSIFRSSVHDEDHEETSRPAGSPVQEPLTATFIFNFGVVRAFDLGLPLARFRLAFPFYISLSLRLALCPRFRSSLLLPLLSIYRFSSSFHFIISAEVRSRGWFSVFLFYSSLLLQGDFYGKISPEFQILYIFDNFRRLLKYWEVGVDVNRRFAKMKNTISNIWFSFLFEFWFYWTKLNFDDGSRSIIAAVTLWNYVRKRGMCHVLKYRSCKELNCHAIYGGKRTN